MQVKGRCARAHQGLWRALHAGGHGGEAKVFYLEAAAFTFVVFSGNDADIVFAVLRCIGNVPALFGHAIGAEAHVEFITRVAASVRDDDLVHPSITVCDGDACSHMGAQEVFHRHGFTCTKQGAIKHGMRNRNVVLRAGIDTELMGRDALVPARQHEARVIAYGCGRNQRRGRVRIAA